MGHTDWQGTMQGAGSTTTPTWSAPPRTRTIVAAWDKELLEHYLERLVEAGGKAPTFDVAWLRYRQAVFYAYSAWSFTIGRAVYQPKMQPDAVSLACIERVAAAIEDLQSLDAVGL